jgi:fructokinase
MKYVVGIGEALFDCLPEGRKLGGAPANFAYHAGQFGQNSIAVSAVGNDSLGREIAALLKERKLPAMLETVPFETGTVQVTLNAAGIPVYEIKENVAWDNIPYTDNLKTLARQTRAVCFGSLAQRSSVSRQTIVSFLDDMPTDDDVLKIFDINLRQHFYSRDVLEESFRRCNILKINDEELAVIAEMYSLGNADTKVHCRQILRRYSLKMLILTCGTAGSYVFTPEKESFQPTPKVDVADTVGAGDSFTGSFVASLLNGKSMEEAHRIAVKVSAYVCTQEGAMPQIPACIIES